MTKWVGHSAEGLYDPAHEHDACGVGFVVDMHGRKSHTIVTQALTILKNLMHRGACGCEENTGDGCGILIQIPHAFLARECGRLGMDLGAPGQYGTGLVFLPRDPTEREVCKTRFAADRGRGRPAPDRLARRADRRLPDRPDRTRGRAGFPADLHRARRRRSTTTASSAGSM